MIILLSQIGMSRQSRLLIFTSMCRSSLFYDISSFCDNGEHFLTKLDGYKYKKGPMGSSRRNKLLGGEEVSNLLNKPRSRLVDYWKRDSVHAWMDSLNKETPDYSPNDL